jgi:peptide/nickel transport system ATP-binding protein
LLRSVPRLTEEGLKQTRLETIEGTVPSLLDLPRGCKFAPRCPYVVEECTISEPPLLEVNELHLARCIRWESVGDDSAKTHAAGSAEIGAGDPPGHRPAL